MELIEREGVLSSLHTCFENTLEGEGHSVFVCGESGIGKTSLVKQFCKEVNRRAVILQGSCDALFTPSPLAPVYDIMLQLQQDMQQQGTHITDRTAFFSQVFLALKNQTHPFIIVFEDIHWADEATLDFIKFLARRITQLPGLFILTYRDNEIHTKHPLRNVLGQLVPGSFSRLQLQPLSKSAVEKLAEEKGYNGEDIYTVSGGNPFYVNELLASYNQGVPDNIKDSILSAYNRLHEKAKDIWEILSVVPTGLELNYFEKINPYYTEAVGICLEHKILLIENKQIAFKHELFRRTIEGSLSPLLRVALNRKILDLFRESFEAHNEIERIVHHAKNANEYDIVVKYAPMAAQHAAALGAHIEAARLYLTGIEYYQKQDKDVLVKFYEAYAYECYLTNQISEAIIYTAKSLEIWKEKKLTEQTGSSLRFLSRLWWFNGNGKNAEQYAAQAIAVLDAAPASKAKAMAFSNMSQLKMLADQSEDCVFWGEKAIAMANELGDEEILAHALNNVGTVQMMTVVTKEKGAAKLLQSLELALKNRYDEHAARAYTNLCSVNVKLKDYVAAEKYLLQGIQYCEERDLNSWTTYMLSWKARLYTETGKWNEALTIADRLINMETSPPVQISVLVAIGLIKMRRGETNALSFLLQAKKLAFVTQEVQRLLPVLTALLEYEWLTGSIETEQKDIDALTALIKNSDEVADDCSFIFWLKKVRGQTMPGFKLFEGYNITNATAVKAASLWEKIGTLYEQALALYEGGEVDKRKAVSIMHQLGATATYEKLIQQMRSSGIKSIPRGMRKSTQANEANLTQREIDIVTLLKDGLQNKEIAAKLFISPKTVDHHISSLLYKLEVNSRTKAAQEAIRLGIIK